MGHLKKGINPLSNKNLDFDPKYISAPIEAGVITALVALAVSTHFALYYFAMSECIIYITVDSDPIDLNNQKLDTQ